MKKYIFLHAAKCAGTTVKKLLPTEHMHNLDAPYSIKQLDAQKLNEIQAMGYQSKMHHWTIEQLNSSGLLKDLLDISFKFTFVRNPFTRLISVYKYSYKSSGNQPSFSDFIYRVLSIVESKSYFLWNEEIQPNHLAPLHLYTHDSDGNPIDFIGKMENFDSDLSSAFELIGIELNKPIAVNNKTIQASLEDIKKYYTPELKKIVYFAYKKDFELLGYS